MFESVVSFILFVGSAYGIYKFIQWYDNNKKGE